MSDAWLMPDESAPTAAAWLSEGVGFWRRTLARLIDIAIHFATGAVAGMAAGIMIVLASAAAGQSPDAAIAAASSNAATGFLAAFLGATAMHCFSEGLHGSTIGKRICGLRVVGVDGSPATLAAALKRQIAFLVDALFLGLVAAQTMKESPLRQRTGDKWARTLVVRLAVVPPEARVPESRFLLAALAGLVTDGCLIFGELIWRAALA